MSAGYGSRCRLIVSTAYPVHAWGTDSNRSSGIRLRLVRIELVFRCTLLTCYLVLKRTPRFRFYLAFGYEDALLDQLIPIRHLFLCIRLSLCDTSERKPKRPAFRTIANGTVLRRYRPTSRAFDRSFSSPLLTLES